MRVVSSPGRGARRPRRPGDHRNVPRPNRGIADAEKVIDDESMNPLREFSAACRDELLRLGALS
jgi:hypothetical protein